MNEINRRFKNYRIGLNKTQLEISGESGVSLATIKKFENGEDIKISTLDKLLKSIGYKNSLDNLIEDVTERPIYKFNAKVRKRVRKTKNNNKFIWGEDK